MAKKAQKKKKAAAKPAAVPQPKDFLDMVAPAAVKFNPDHTIAVGAFWSYSFSSRPCSISLIIVSGALIYISSHSRCASIKILIALSVSFTILKYIFL